MVPVGKIVTPKIKKELTGPTRTELRLLEAAASDSGDDSILYQHSALCQVYLPYRDPGDAVRRWTRRNGLAHIELDAGRAMHPEHEILMDVGLPFGTKARMLLMYLNRVAIINQSPVIDVGRSLTHFVERGLGFSSQGRNIRAIKEQLVRLSAASIRMGVAYNGHAITIQSGFVRAFDLELWMQKDETQRVLWPSTLTLSLDYYNDLIAHAVPVDAAHIAALSHSALALDIYNWLAQRLHRVPVERPQSISWLSLHEQFGQGYASNRIDNFRRIFRIALKDVLTVYRDAHVEDEEAKQARRRFREGRIIWRSELLPGLKLFHSAPPIKKSSNS